MKIQKKAKQLQQQLSPEAAKFLSTLKKAASGGHCRGGGGGGWN